MTDTYKLTTPSPINRMNIGRTHTSSHEVNYFQTREKTMKRDSDLYRMILSMNKTVHSLQYYAEGHLITTNVTSYPFIMVYHKLTLFTCIINLLTTNLLFCFDHCTLTEIQMQNEILDLSTLLNHEEHYCAVSGRMLIRIQQLPRWTYFVESSDVIRNTHPK